MDDQYDDFGNYIGPLDDAEDAAAAGGWAEEEPEEDDGGAGAGGAGAGAGALVVHGAASLESAIVLQEDKKFYPEAREVYPDAETLVQDEDTQPLSKPIIAPVSTKRFSADEALPETTYDPAFLTGLLATPSLTRVVAVVGHLLHGKTSFVDRLIESTHVGGWPSAASGDEAPRRYTDARRDEQARGLSIKATPVSLVLPSSAGKSFVVTVVDTPGHVDFCDEVSAALRAVDGVVLVVDAVEGVMLATTRIIAAAVAERLPLTLVVSKVDRLILELKLPPADAYFKLAHTIQEVNDAVAAAAAALPPADAPGAPPAPAYAPLTPLDGSVIFASAAHGWSLSLQSWARAHCAAARSAGAPAPADAAAFAARLWGDLFFDPASGRFRSSAPPGGARARSFVEFVLEPLYKVYAQVLGEEPAALADTLAPLGVRLTAAERHLDPAPLLKLVLSRLLGGPAAFVDMVTAHLPSPADAAAATVARAYAGPPGGAAAAAMRACDASGPLMVNVVKLTDAPDAGAFLALGRVLSGTLRAGQAVRVLGEAFSATDDEDMAVRAVTAVALGQARYRVGLSAAPAGALVLIAGLDGAVAKTATLTDDDDGAAGAGPGETPAAAAAAAAAAPPAFRPLAFSTTACVNLSVEPLNPSELPSVLAGLRKIGQSYPLARTRVEESGEHVIVATGELALDCIMHDLRVMYAGVEIKVADPVTSFCETLIDTSSVPCAAATPNKKNKLTMIAEPLGRGLAEAIEAGAVSAAWDRRRLADALHTKFSWDMLAARNVWGFGPTARGPNALVDDTLASEVDKALLRGVKDSVVQGFQWACKEGPLCDEPIRGAKWRLLGASVAAEPIYRGGGQVIPTARRAAYSAFLLGSPRMMEPVLATEILAPADAMQTIYNVLARRRGHITSDAPKPGTPFYVVRGLLPAIDSFGFETDLRVHTHGQASCLTVFDHWAVAPGDPLDKTIILRPLEPAPPPHLAREFMVKTRRRKGLAEDVSIARFFDDEMLLALASSERAAGSAT